MRSVWEIISTIEFSKTSSRGSFQFLHTIFRVGYHFNLSYSDCAYLLQLGNKKTKNHSILCPNEFTISWKFGTGSKMEF